MLIRLLFFFIVSVIAVSSEAQNNCFVIFKNSHPYPFAMMWQSNYIHAYNNNCLLLQKVPVGIQSFILYINNQEPIHFSIDIKNDMVFVIQYDSLTNQIYLQNLRNGMQYKSDKWSTASSFLLSKDVYSKDATKASGLSNRPSMFSPLANNNIVLFFIDNSEQAGVNMGYIDKTISPTDTITLFVPLIPDRNRLVDSSHQVVSTQEKSLSDKLIPIASIKEIKGLLQQLKSIKKEQDKFNAILNFLQYHFIQKKDAQTLAELFKNKKDQYNFLSIIYQFIVN